MWSGRATASGSRGALPSAMPRASFAPHTPVAMYGDVAEFPPEAGGLSRTFIRCALDRTLLPSTCEAIVADMDRARPSSPTTLVDLESSHEAMFSRPDELAALLIAAT